ncbi:MAG: class II aldolase/adducin family protein [Actinomycetota bacterium]|nr:class II aldolase/adducin family protein [Actinomycetota bacterium]
MADNSDTQRRMVTTASRILAAHGHGDLLWGHASSRDPDGRGVWIKAAGWGLEETRPDRVHLLDRAGRVLMGPRGAHSEYPIHTEIMEARPDVGGVVHTHAPHAVALAAAGCPLLPVSHAATLFVPPDVPRFDATGDLILTADRGRAVADVLGEASAVFLVNHGIVTVGVDLPSATVAAVLLERACEQQLRTAAAAGWPTWSNLDEALVKRSHLFSPRSVAATWDYLVRAIG